jgi:pimeloyl-ACP methyl ester carboxylesterase
MVSVGTHALHVRQQGTGGPVVVFEAGAGAWSAHWGALPGLVAAHTTTIVYDRAGLGHSESGPRPRDCEAHAIDLDRLLRALAPGDDSPVVLVAHSYGALVARMVATRSPRRASGLVFLDGYPAGFEAASRAAGLATPSMSPWLLDALRLAGHLGIPRLLLAIAKRFSASAPASSSLPDEEIESLLLEPRVQRALADELRAGDAGEAQVSALEPTLPVPLTVVSAAQTLPPEHAPRGFDVDAYNRLWLAAQRDLVGLHPGARHVVLQGDHMLHLAQAATIADLILEHVARERG